MLSSAQLALESGFDVLRLNVRNCGGTERLCRTLYHSGLTVDLRRVVEELAPRPLFLLGFSMGGNIALKLAGEWGGEPPAHVRAMCAVSAPIELDLCSRNIGRPRNFVYERRFLRQLRAAVRRKHAVMPELFPDPEIAQVESIWEFDERVTAPAFGFADAADYYRQCSSARFLGRHSHTCVAGSGSGRSVHPVRGLRAARAGDQPLDCAPQSEARWARCVSGARAEKILGYRAGAEVLRDAHRVKTCCTPLRPSEPGFGRARGNPHAYRRSLRLANR